MGKQPSKKQKTAAAVEKGRVTKAANLHQQEDLRAAWEVQSAWLATVSADRLAGMLEAEKHNPKTQKYFEEVDRTARLIKEAADQAAADTEVAARANLPHQRNDPSLVASSSSDPSSADPTSKSPMEKDMDAEADPDKPVETEVVRETFMGVVQLDVVNNTVEVGDDLVEVGDTMVMVPAGCAIGGAPAKQSGGFKIAPIFLKAGAKKLDVPQSLVLCPDP
jgi:hypothetical protein